MKSLFILCLCQLLFVNNVRGVEDRVRLESTLLNLKYVDEMTIPGNISLEVDLSLLDFQLDSSREYATVNVQESYTWIDVQLAWIASDFGGLQSISLPDHYIWTPDIRPYAGKDLQRYDSDPDDIVEVYSNGRVNWSVKTNFTLRCATFRDENSGFCSFEYRSRTHDAPRLVSKSNRVDMSRYVSNSKLELKSTGARSAYYIVPYVDFFISYTYHKEHEQQK